MKQFQVKQEHMARIAKIFTDSEGEENDENPPSSHEEVKIMKSA